jgi:hypothetical protein
MSVRELDNFAIQEFSGELGNIALLKFPISKEGDVSVYVRTYSGDTPVSTVKLNKNLYTVKIRSQVISGVYAEVTLKETPTPATGGDSVRSFAVRETVREQLANFPSISLSSDAYSDVLNNALDKLTMEVQDLGDRTLKASPEDMQYTNDTKNKIDLTLPIIHGNPHKTLCVNDTATGFVLAHMEDDFIPQPPLRLADNKLWLDFANGLGLDAQGKLEEIYWRIIEEDGKQWLYGQTADKGFQIKAEAVQISTSGTGGAGSVGETSNSQTTVADANGTVTASYKMEASSSDMGAESTASISLDAAGGIANRKSIVHLEAGNGTDGQGLGNTMLEVRGDSVYIKRPGQDWIEIAAGDYWRLFERNFALKSGVDVGSFVVRAKNVFDGNAIESGLQFNSEKSFLNFIKRKGSASQDFVESRLETSFINGNHACTISTLDKEDLRAIKGKSLTVSLDSVQIWDKSSNPKDVATTDQIFWKKVQKDAAAETVVLKNDGLTPLAFEANYSGLAHESKIRVDDDGITLAAAEKVGGKPPFGIFIDPRSGKTYYLEFDASPPSNPAFTDEIATVGYVNNTITGQSLWANDENIIKLKTEPAEGFEARTQLDENARRLEQAILSSEGGVKLSEIHREMDGASPQDNYFESSLELIKDEKNDNAIAVITSGIIEDGAHREYRILTVAPDSVNIRKNGDGGEAQEVATTDQLLWEKNLTSGVAELKTEINDSPVTGAAIGVKTIDGVESFELDILNKDKKITLSGIYKQLNFARPDENYFKTFLELSKDDVDDNGKFPAIIRLSAQEYIMGSLGLIHSLIVTPYGVYIVKTNGGERLRVATEDKILWNKDNGDTIAIKGDKNLNFEVKLDSNAQPKKIRVNNDRIELSGYDPDIGKSVGIFIYPSGKSYYTSFDRLIPDPKPEDEIATVGDVEDAKIELSGEILCVQTDLDDKININKDAIAENELQIEILTSQDADIVDEISGLRGSVATNTTNIAANTTNIAANTAQISKNVSDIGGLQEKDRELSSDVGDLQSSAVSVEANSSIEKDNTTKNIDVKIDNSTLQRDATGIISVAEGLTGQSLWETRSINSYPTLTPKGNPEAFEAGAYGPYPETDPSTDPGASISLFCPMGSLPTEAVGQVIIKTRSRRDVNDVSVQEGEAGLYIAHQEIQLNRQGPEGQSQLALHDNSAYLTRGTAAEQEIATVDQIPTVDPNSSIRIDNNKLSVKHNDTIDESSDGTLSVCGYDPGDALTFHTDTSIEVFGEPTALYSGENPVLAWACSPNGDYFVYIRENLEYTVKDQLGTRQGVLDGSPRTRPIYLNNISSFALCFQKEQDFYVDFFGKISDLYIGRNLNGELSILEAAGQGEICYLEYNWNIHLLLEDGTIVDGTLSGCVGFVGFLSDSGHLYACCSNDSGYFYCVKFSGVNIVSMFRVDELRDRYAFNIVFFKENINLGKNVAVVSLKGGNGRSAEVYSFILDESGVSRVRKHAAYDGKEAYGIYNVEGEAVFWTEAGMLYGLEATPIGSWPLPLDETIRAVCYSKYSLNSCENQLSVLHDNSTIWKIDVLSLKSEFASSRTINVNYKSPLSLTSDNKLTVKVAGPLSTDVEGSLTVNVGEGLAVNNGSIGINAGPGLLVNEDVVSVNAGEGLEVFNSELRVRHDDTIQTTEDGALHVEMPSAETYSAGEAISFTPLNNYFIENFAQTTIPQQFKKAASNEDGSVIVGITDTITGMYTYGNWSEEEEPSRSILKDIKYVPSKKMFVVLTSSSQTGGSFYFTIPSVSPFVRSTHYYRTFDFLTSLALGKDDRVYAYGYGGVTLLPEDLSGSGSGTPVADTENFTWSSACYNHVAQKLYFWGSNQGGDRYVCELTSASTGIIQPSLVQFSGEPQFVHLVENGASFYLFFAIRENSLIYFDCNGLNGQLDNYYVDDSDKILSFENNFFLFLGDSCRFGLKGQIAGGRPGYLGSAHQIYGAGNKVFGLFDVNSELTFCSFELNLVGLGSAINVEYESSLKTENNKLSVRIAEGGGLRLGSNGVSINAGKGIIADSDGAAVNYAPQGLAINEYNQLEIRTGKGISIEEFKLSINASNEDFSFLDVMMWNYSPQEFSQAFDAYVIGYDGVINTFFGNKWYKNWAQYKTLEGDKVVAAIRCRYFAGDGEAYIVKSDSMGGTYLAISRLGRIGDILPFEAQTLAYSETFHRIFIFGKGTSMAVIDTQVLNDFSIVEMLDPLYPSPSYDVDINFVGASDFEFALFGAGGFLTSFYIKSNESEYLGPVFQEWTESIREDVRTLYLVNWGDDRNRFAVAYVDGAQNAWVECITIFFTGWNIGCERRGLPLELRAKDVQAVAYNPTNGNFYLGCKDYFGETRYGYQFDFATLKVVPNYSFVFYGWSHATQMFFWEDKGYISYPEYSGPEQSSNPSRTMRVDVTYSQKIFPRISVPAPPADGDYVLKSSNGILSWVNA